MATKNAVLGALITAAVLVSGCGGAVSPTALPAEVDVRTLDVGPYPTEPSNAHDDDYVPDYSGRQRIAAARLANSVVSAYEIDSAMKYGRSATLFGATWAPDDLGERTANEAIIKRHKMVYGFETHGSDDTSYVSTYPDWPRRLESKPKQMYAATMVLQFPNAEQATAAAAEFYEADFARYREQNQPITLPKHPAARAHWQPGNGFARTTLAHGPYVVAFLLATTEADPNALAALADRAYELQLPLLDKLTPLSPDEVWDLPWDPDHVLKRVLNPDKAALRPDYNDFYVTGKRGLIQFADNRELATDRLGAMNVIDFAVLGDTMVARAADSAAAEMIVTDRITPTPVAGEAAAPANVPHSACVENKVDSKLGGSNSRRFTCLVAYREYVGFVHSAQLVDAHQQAAAQYAVFANTR